jgi:hypothetical protein
VTRWAARTLGHSAEQYLAAIRSQGPVAVIATPRVQVQCRPQRDWASVESDAALTDFDNVPLTDDAGRTITHVYVRGTGRVELQESMFMSAGAPLIDFLETADQQRSRLLVDGRAVTALVTLSDVQKLPVYGLLFGLLIAVEMLLMDWIRKACSDEPDAWLNLLVHKQRKSIESNWLDAVQKDLTIDRLALASFGQEIQAAAGLGLFSGNEQRRHDMDELKALRDLVFHAAEFAPTPAHALRIPQYTRNAQAMATWLNERVHRTAA